MNIQDIQFLISKVDFVTILVLGFFAWKLYIKIIERIEKFEVRLEGKLEKMETKLTELDKRIVAIETMLHMKDCCMLKDDRQLKKAE